MGIAKFDDGIPDNPKFIAAGPVASWLWFCGVLYCRRALTDGFIPKQKVPTLVVGLAQPFKHAASLVGVHLWDEALGGYQVHDYLEWNPSKYTIEEYRRRDKERKHKQNPDRIPDGFRSGNGTDSERRGASRAGAKSKSTSEKESKDLDRGESAREGDEPDVPPVWSPTRPSRSGLATNHPACHELAGAACGRGVCVPKFLIDREWLPQAQHDRASVTQFVEAVIAHLPSSFVGDDPLKFWRSKWLAAHGSQIETAPARPRSLGPNYAKYTHWEDECQELHDGRCGNATMHSAQMEADAEAAAS